MVWVPRNPNTFSLMELPGEHYSGKWFVSAVATLVKLEAYTSLALKEINNKVPCSTGNYILTMNYNRKESEKECMYV